MEADDPICYGDAASYARAIEFLDGVGTLEDWGCGTCYARRYVKKARYVGIDQITTKFNFVTVDLANYRSKADYILLRHVLEQTDNWRSILSNAVYSFRRRMCVVVQTPMADQTQVVNRGFNNVPLISFLKSDLTGAFSRIYTEETVGTDTLFCLQRP